MRPVFLLIATTSLIFHGCSYEASKSGDQSSPATEADTSIDRTSPPQTTQYKKLTGCKSPTPTFDDPQSIEDVITLVNALPKPQSVSCYLQALRRPLRLYATTSQLSVQPAMGASSPRIFLFSGPLITAILPQGDGSQWLELSLLINHETSIKGELEFPVTKNLSTSAAYDRVLRFDAAGTRCVACHPDEKSTFTAFGIRAYISKALRPHPEEEVPLQQLFEITQSCSDQMSQRCEVLKSIFDFGEVISQRFPDTMPTL